MLQNIAELKSITSSQNSVAEGCESCDTDEEYNLNENDSNTFENCDAILEIGKNGLPKQKQRCRHPFDKSRSCYILVLPIEQQLKFFLESGGMKLRKETTGYDGTTLGDVQSGNCYREKVCGVGSENQVIFTLQLNVDGAQCFKKSKFGFWPFMGVINEIPYGARRANMFLMRNSSHSKENDSFVTPKRNKKSSAKNSDSQILTSLDVNIFDTPPSSTTKGNPKRVLDEQATEPVDAELHSLNEYKDTIDELKNEISFLNEQIRDSTFELEIERDDYNHKIFEKDATILRLQEEINSLKQLNPQALAKSLNEGLALLHTTLETLTISQVNAQQSRVQLERSESGRTNLVKLHKDYETTIHQNALATAMSYGKAGSKKKDMSKMINIIMEALWDREFMSKHSLTGKKAPTDKTNNPAKPALPKEDVQAITSFIVEFWGTKHKLAIDPSMVHPCTTSKLLSEHTAHKSREKLFVEDAGNEVPSD
ncbi:uncharacterized protein LOC123476941 [Daphnia magna]|uniref:uncharacterized protein LOC123476941 n=1 Tax=Daphnia magna TaxID=35525 RepID=UPI001E1BC1C9|nr:uncharacterized protein LOC123476941 [Daphnia magna]